jgi:hypothetical protein
MGDGETPKLQVTMPLYAVASTPRLTLTRVDAGEHNGETKTPMPAKTGIGVQTGMLRNRLRGPRRSGGRHLQLERVRCVRVMGDDSFDDNASEQ